MSDAFEELKKTLKRLPGLGYRSAERLALHVLLEKPETADELLEKLVAAKGKVTRCPVTGDMADEGGLSRICQNGNRRRNIVCVVETVADLMAFENSGAYQGWYHVLHGKLSPVQGIGPEHLFIEPLRKRIEAGEVEEIILALSNDIEGEATCHYLQSEIIGDADIPITRIGFGLPSGGGVTYADGATLRSALESRRPLAR